MTSLLLADRQILRVSGVGAVEFLQGLVTQDLSKNALSNMFLGTLFLTPKGRMLSEGFISRRESHVLIDLPKQRSDAVANMLTLHKLRLPIAIEKDDDHVVTVSTKKEEADDTHWGADPRSTDLPRRSIVPSCNGDIPPDHNNWFKSMRIQAGVPEGPDEIPYDSAIPIHYNFDLMNCISFTKGCYTGQELITRTLRRGVIRRRCFVVKTTNGAELPSAGASLTVGDSNGSETVKGSIISAVGNMGIAMVDFGGAPLNSKEQIMTAVKSVSSELYVNDIPVSLEVPSYMSPT